MAMVPGTSPARPSAAVLSQSSTGSPSDVKNGIQGSAYALRTVILPIIWIFYPPLLLIDVPGTWESISVVRACTLATLLFALLTMGWFRVNSR